MFELIAQNRFYLLRVALLTIIFAGAIVALFWNA